LAKPVVDRLERDLVGQAEVLQLNATGGVGRELAARYGVRGVPTFFLFDGMGELVSYQVGRLDAALAKSEIEALEK